MNEMAWLLRGEPCHRTDHLDPQGRRRLHVLIAAVGRVRQHLVGQRIFAGYVNIESLDGGRFIN